ncbi:hypothetical protein [Pseudomonas trivialis]|uniref:Uncharacterized protein n=1 Tax=Pseudomonas trivialis TaxID=200450 RepID=A0ABY0UMG7_9PSED|nr:hypothetical protein [Pseudomonas trivialis]SDS91031.1 hypothetical protein SAMN04490205_4058 [Pseudomonas trivialis]
MTFRIKGLSPEPFKTLPDLPEHNLATLGVIRYQVDSHPGFPDRIELKDAEKVESVVLLNHVCEPALSVEFLSAGNILYTLGIKDLTTAAATRLGGGPCEGRKPASEGSGRT